MAALHKNDPRIRFTGYVAEDAIADLFQGTSIAVMPYTSSAGSSGVAHLACEYGVPIVASDIADFRAITEEEGIAIDLFESGNVNSLAQHLLDLLQNPERLEDMAQHNFSAALRMSMPEIIRQYTRSFNLQHRIKMLRAASRFRRLPRWMPLRPALSRRVGQRFLNWHDSELTEYLNLAAAASPSNGNGHAQPTAEVDVDDTLPSPVIRIDEGSARKGDAA